MKLRFEIDQAEAFRRGIDAPKSTATVEVDPAKMTPELRERLASRLRGIDVYTREQVMAPTGEQAPFVARTTRAVMAPTGEFSLSHRRLVAKAPTIEGLLEAIDENDKAIGAIAERASV